MGRRDTGDLCLLSGFERRPLGIGGVRGDRSIPTNCSSQLLGGTVGSQPGQHHAALQLVCIWAFEALHTEIVTLTTLEGNRASERVAEKGGFQLVEQISEYKPMVARDPQASYEMKRWMREQQI